MIKNTKSQNWSIEVIISTTVFLSILIISLILIFNLPETNSKDISKSAEVSMDRIQRELDLNINKEIETDKIEELAKEVESGKELGEILKVDGDVCITFESLDGEAISIQTEENGEAKYINGIGVNEQGICGN